MAARDKVSKPAARRDPLAAYEQKRDFSRTTEPKSKPASKPKPKPGAADGREFVVQKHDARRLHYDLRLELDGVLKSWAVTRGPSLIVGEKRLAVRTEDHPMQYLEFEGNIPKGEYGGGTMIVWDRGRWERASATRTRGWPRATSTFTLDGGAAQGPLASGAHAAAARARRPSRGC